MESRLSVINLYRRVMRAMPAVKIAYKFELPADTVRFHDTMMWILLSTCTLPTLPWFSAGLGSDPASRPSADSLLCYLMLRLPTLCLPLQMKLRMADKFRANAGMKDPRAIAWTITKGEKVRSVASCQDTAASPSSAHPTPARAQLLF